MTAAPFIPLVLPSGLYAGVYVAMHSYQSRCHFSNVVRFMALLRRDASQLDGFELVLKTQSFDKQTA